MRSSSRTCWLLIENRWGEARSAPGHSILGYCPPTESLAACWRVCTSERHRGGMATQPVAFHLVHFHFTSFHFAALYCMLLAGEVRECTSGVLILLGTSTYVPLDPTQCVRVSDIDSAACYSSSFKRAGLHCCGLWFVALFFGHTK